MDIKNNNEHKSEKKGIMQIMQSLTKKFPSVSKERASFKEVIKKKVRSFIKRDSELNMYLLGVDKNGEDYFRKRPQKSKICIEYASLENPKGMIILNDEVYATHTIDKEMYISLFKEIENKWEKLENLNFFNDEKTKTRFLANSISITKKGKFKSENSKNFHENDIHSDQQNLYCWIENQWNILGKKDENGNYRINNIPEGYNLFYEGSLIKMENSISPNKVKSIKSYPISIKPLKDKITKISEEPLQYKISLSDYNVMFTKAVCTEIGEIDIEYGNLTITMLNNEIPENISLISDSYGISCHLNLENWIM